MVWCAREHPAVDGAELDMRNLDLRLDGVLYADEGAGGLRTYPASYLRFLCSSRSCTSACSIECTVYSDVHSPPFHLSFNGAQIITFVAAGALCAVGAP